MNTRMLHLSGLVAVLALGACATSPNQLNKKPIEKTYQEDPTQEPSQAPGAYNGGAGNTFDHFADLGALGSRDPFDLLAQREEEGPAEVRTRLHSCQKVQVETLKNILVGFGVDMGKQSNPPSAGQLYKGGLGALGVANYDARVGETIVWSAAGAAKLFDIFVQAAPEIIANIAGAPQCQVNGAGSELFDASNKCNADAVTCLIGRPAGAAQIDICNTLVQSASDLTTGKNIAVATMLAAAHTCE
jgi:hypothetical protein